MKSIVVLISGSGSNLQAIIDACAAGFIAGRISAVVSNKAGVYGLQRAAEANIPVVVLDHKAYPDRQSYDVALQQAIDSYQPDLVVLAGFMRILTPAFVAQYPNRIINIHHSFLPAFIGANPYRQAFDRGVKIIGATAHFVNDHLDEGPIIQQMVAQVDHNFSADDMARAGRDVEKAALSKALQYIVEDRVFVHGNKTVIL